MLLRSRFKNTKDMWLYMSERRKYLFLWATERDREPKLVSLRE